MVAITSRHLKKTVYKSKLARNAGAAYGYDVLVDPESMKFEKLMAEGLSSFGSGGALSPFGGELKSLGSGALYPFGSGIMTMGTGLTPFGMGLLSKLKGFARKASSVIRGAIPQQLRRSAVDFGKKRARELLPKVMAKVKEEIGKEAPGLVSRLTDPLVGKLPPSVQEGVSGFVKKGTQKGLEALQEGLSSAEKAALARIGSGLRSFGGGALASQVSPLPVPTSDPVDLNQRQLAFMRQQGENFARQHQAGNVPKRLILDQHSRSLLDQIMADKGYERVQQDDAREQLGLMGRPSASESMSVPRAMKKIAAPKRAKKAAGRPKGSKVSGKGIVYL